MTVKNGPSMSFTTLGLPTGHFKQESRRIRLIGICETVHRTIAKAILSSAKLDVLKTTGPLQLCVGHIAGAEAAIHSVRSTFYDSSAEGALLVDASNDFNSLNCRAALDSIRHLCPILAVNHQTFLW